LFDIKYGRFRDRIIIILTRLFITYFKKNLQAPKLSEILNGYYSAVNISNPLKISERAIFND